MEDAVVENTSTETTATETDTASVSTSDSTGVLDTSTTTETASTTLLDTSETVSTTDTSDSNWYDGISDDFKTDKIMEFGSLDDLAKSFINAQEMIGKKGVLLPEAEATDEQLADFYKQLGRPEESTAYELEAIPDDLKDFMGIDEGNIRDMMLGMNLNQAQAGKMWEGIREMVSSDRDAFIATTNQNGETAIKELRSEWGDDNFDSNVKAANEAMNKLGLKDMVAELGLVNDSRMVKALAQMGQALGSDNGASIGDALDGNGVSNLKSAEERKSEAVRTLAEAQKSGNLEAIKKARAAVNKVFGR